MLHVIFLICFSFYVVIIIIISWITNLIKSNNKKEEEVKNDLGFCLSSS